MQFFMHRTSYDFARLVADKLRSRQLLPDPQVFYAETIASEYHRRQSPTLSFLGQSDSSRSTYNQLLAELQWYKNGKPYYNFHPRLIKVFGKAKLNFPAKYLSFPYNCLAVNFSDSDNTFRIDETHRLKSCLVYRGKVVNSYKDTIVTKPEAIQSEVLLIYCDFNETVPQVMYDSSRKQEIKFNEPIMAWRQIRWESEETVEQALDNLPIDWSDVYGLRIPDEMLAMVIKIVASIAFLAQDNSPIIVPHLLRKDQGYLRNRDSSDALIQKLHDKATKERGARGFVVGSQEMFDQGYIGPAPDQKEHEISGRELQSAHIVSGYWKLCRYGPKMEHGRVRWIMPHVRGWGKPFKHEEE